MDLSVTETEQIGRFTVVRGSPPVAPGKCAVCGTVHGEFIDFGFDLDFYGVVYFCSTCFGEGTDAFNGPKLKAYEEGLRKANEVIRKLSEENGELRNALGIVDRVRVSTIDPDQLELFDSKTLEPTTESDNGDSEPEQSEDRGSEESESGHDESSDESGHSSVQHDDSLEQLLDL